MLGGRLPRHRQRPAQFPEGLAVAFAEPVQQRPPRRIGQGAEHHVVLAHPSRAVLSHRAIMQVITCMMQPGG